MTAIPVVAFQNPKSRMTILELDANAIAEAIKQGWAMVTTVAAVFGFIFYWYFRAQKAERKASELRKAAEFDRMVSAVKENTESVDELTSITKGLTVEQHKTNTHLEVLTERVNNIDARVKKIEGKHND